MTDEYVKAVEKGDTVSSICIASNNLLCVIGGVSSDPSIYAVPLKQFAPDRANSRNLASWIKYEVDPGAAICYVIADRWTVRRLFVGVIAQQPTWLDLERAQQKNPNTSSLDLLDIHIIWDASPFDPHNAPNAEQDTRHPNPSCCASRFFKLQLQETCGSNGFFNLQFVQDNGWKPTRLAPRPVAWHLEMSPTRSGRLVYYHRHRTALAITDMPEIHENEEDRNASALALTSVDGVTNSVPLTHLNDRKIERAMLDYYTSALFLAFDTTPAPDPFIREHPTERRFEIVVEHYE